MNKNGLLLFAGIVAGLGLGLALILSSQKHALPSGPATGKPALDFTLTGLNGKSVKLSNFKGKIVVVNFWATWCEPCKTEMPLFEEAYQKNSDEVVVLAVNDGESPEIVSHFVSALGLTFPIALDPKSDISRQYFIRAYPTSLFLDTNGIIRAQHVGVLDEGLLSEYLEIAGIKP